MNTFCNKFTSDACTAEQHGICFRIMMYKLLKTRLNDQITKQKHSIIARMSVHYEI